MVRETMGQGVLGSQRQIMKYMSAQVWGHLALVVLLALCLLLSGCITAVEETAIATQGFGTVAETEISDQNRQWAETLGNGRYKVGNPYQIKGNWFYPKEETCYDEVGIGSWYGADFHGGLTANGETFDMHRVSAAHKTLPLPSIVKVTNLENGRSLIVRVNDRGPYDTGKLRIIDLSYKAAQLLGFADKGTAKVRVQILKGHTDQAVNLLKQKKPVPAATGAADAILAPAGVASPTPETPAASGGNALPAGTMAAANYITADAPDLLEVIPTGPGKAVVETPKEFKGTFVQVAAFSKSDNAKRLVDNLQSLGEPRIIEALVNGNLLYRVRFGPLKQLDQANTLLEKVLQAGYPDARIVIDQ